MYKMRAVGPDRGGLQAWRPIPATRSSLTTRRGTAWTLAAAAALLLAVALLATLQPARRAARVDPVRAISGPLN